MKRAGLIAICKERKIKGHSKKNMEELVKIIQQNEITPVSASKTEVDTDIKTISPVKIESPKMNLPVSNNINPKMSSYTYAEAIQAIKEECSKINFTYSKEGDGRITSAINEKPYLDKLESGLKEKYPLIDIIRPKDRFWYDIQINGIPINLKLTTGTTDNAFNKHSILTSISCFKPSISQNTNFNKLYNELKSCTKLKERNPSTEYHYLVVHKTTGTILLKSILDIHSYKPNPSNILQISWNNEFNNIDYACEDFKTKIRELLKTIQTSLKKQYENNKKFIEADIDTDFA
jgi:hypothetical protein